MFKLSLRFLVYLTAIGGVFSAEAAPKRKKRLSKKAQKLNSKQKIQVVSDNPSARYYYLFDSDYAVVNLKSPQDALEIVRKILPSNPVILEAGAYDGSDAVNLARTWPNGMVYSFEPIGELFAKASQTITTAGVSNAFIFNYALGDYVGAADMFVSEEPNAPGVPSQSSSLLAPKEHLVYFGTQFLRNTIVPVITIDAWAQEHNISHVDLLWLDMQGYELPALMASPKIFKTVKAVLMEVEFAELYAGQYQFDQVKAWFESQGFELFALHINGQSFGDALFIRKS